jgi:hypothetical protein
MHECVCIFGDYAFNAWIPDPGIISSGVKLLYIPSPPFALQLVPSTTTSRANHPKLHANNAKLLPFVTQRLIPKSLTSRTMSYIQRVVKPQSVVAAS